MRKKLWNRQRKVVQSNLVSIPAIFDKYVHRQNEKEQMNIKGTMLNQTGQRGNLKRNIHKLEHLREKATIRKYNHSCRKKKRIIFLVSIFFLMAAFCINVYAEPGISISDEGITIRSSDDPEEVSNSIKLLLYLTVLSILPSILIMMTSFTRIIIVLSFLRNALGTQQMPPNQVLIGLALFLTLFIMSPVLADLNDQALKPFSDNEITMEQAIDSASQIMKDFMLNKARTREGSGSIC